MSENKTVEIFWTGGYDSTFRICQLSRQNVCIQPYYLSDRRQSENYELNAIKSITNRLINDNKTKAEFLPLKYIDYCERKTNDNITNAFSKLLKSDFMGSQYEWLGVFSLEHKGIELSIHKDDKAVLLIEKHGKLVDRGGYYVVDDEDSSPELTTLFGNFHFPLIDYTKLDMKREYEEMGMSDIIEQTWFCHSPIDGKPCGQCNPCVYTIEEGMEYRFSQEALQRYRRVKKKNDSIVFKLLRNIRKKI